MEISVGNFWYLRECPIIPHVVNIDGSKREIQVLYSRECYKKWKKWKFTRQTARITDVLDLVYTYGEEEAFEIVRKYKHNTKVLENADFFIRRLVPPENRNEAEEILLKVRNIVEAER